MVFKLWHIVVAALAVSSSDDDGQQCLFTSCSVLYLVYYCYIVRCAQMCNGFKQKKHVSRTATRQGGGLVRQEDALQQLLAASIVC